MPKNINLDVAHFSMQFSDSVRQKKLDAEHIFSRGYDWITGTEAGEEPFTGILAASAKKNGYTFHEYKGNWISVRKALIFPGTRRSGGDTVTDTSLVAGPGHDPNIAWVTFRNAELGQVTVMASHYATKGDPSAHDPARHVNVKWNKKLAKAIGAKARLFGSGKKLVFYGGDQNILDRINDTFFGEPLTSTWDELGRWDNTGHGNIDVIASYDPDVRVQARYTRALDDSELHMFMDHYPVEAGFSVRGLS